MKEIKAGNSKLINCLNRNNSHSLIRKHCDIPVNDVENFYKLWNHHSFQ